MGGMGAMGASKSNDSLKKEGEAKVYRKLGGYGARIRFTPELTKRLAEIRAKIASCKTEADFEKLANCVADGGMGIRPELAKEIASGKAQLGQISPASGTNNTIQLDKEHYACLDTGTVYKLSFRADSKNPKKVYAEWTWKPNNGENECSECSRARKTVVKALATIGIKEAQFDKMPWKARVEVIEKLRTSGALKQIKTASKRESSVISEFKKIAGFNEELNKAFFNKFPIETCRRKLANRFGQNAVALSGPCEGQNLADCVCNALKKASIYNDNLAVKVAQIWGDYDGSIKCIEDRVREGFELKVASACCEVMKAKFAGIDDQFTEELADNMTEGVDSLDKEPEGIIKDNVIDPDSDMDNAFDSGESMDETDTGVATDLSGDADLNSGDDTVSIEIPKALVEKLDKVFDVALGEDPTQEEHHNVQNIGNENAGEISTDISADGSGLDVPVEGGEPSPMEGGDVGGGDMGGGGGDMSAAIGGPVGGGAAPAAPASNKPMIGGPIEIELEGLELGEPTEIPVEIIEETQEEDSDNDSDDDEDNGDDDNDNDPKGEGKPELPEENEENEEKNEGIFEDILNETEDSPVSEEEGTYKEGDDKLFTPEEKEAKSMSDELLKHAKQMHRSNIGQTGKIHLDLHALASKLNKKADGVPESETVKVKEQELSEKGLVEENAQDSKDIGKVDGDQKFPNEKPVEDKKLEVPTKGDDAKLGEEKPVKAGDPKVPAGKGKFPNESNEGGDTRATGGDKSQGSAKVASNSYKQRLADLAARIVAKRNVTADKVDDKKQNQDRPDNVGKYSDGDGAIGDQKPFSANEITEKDYTGGTDAGFISEGEKETQKTKPNYPANAPEIPFGKGQIKNEPNDSEQGSSVNGTVATAQESDARKKVYAEAVRIAGRMVEEGKCKANDLLSKIAELRRYEIGTLKDIEKYIFSTPSNAGLDTVSNGVEQAVIVSGSDSAGIQKSAQSQKDELTSKLQGLFSLHRKNAQAESDDTVQLRRAFGR
jgi:hypothetical protein